LHFLDLSVADLSFFVDPALATHETVKCICGSEPEFERPTCCLCSSSRYRGEDRDFTFLGSVSSYSLSI
jgi:hypothetical protein